MIRLAEAYAKMHLREYIRSDDVTVTINFALDSFISAQKHNMTKILWRVSFYLVLNKRDIELTFSSTAIQQIS